MIRVDENDIPKLVQSWTYDAGATVQCRLINDRRVILDLYTVRDFSCRGYVEWGLDTDQMAVDLFIDAHKHLFLVQH